MPSLETRVADLERNVQSESRDNNLLVIVTGLVPSGTPPIQIRSLSGGGMSWYIEEGESESDFTSRVSNQVLSYGCRVSVVAANVTKE